MLGVNTFKKDDSAAAGESSRSISPDCTLNAIRSATEIGEIQDSGLLDEVRRSSLNDERRSGIVPFDISQFLTYANDLDPNLTSDDDNDIVEIGSANFLRKSTGRFFAVDTPGNLSSIWIPQGANFDLMKYKAWVGKYLQLTE